MQAFWLALQFLTRLPTPQLAEISPLALGRSVLFYPLIGGIIGALLLSLGHLAEALPDSLLAAMVLALWVYLSGALHIDGLADMADAWVGGQGDRERTLTIMKDPYCGPVGVTSVVMVLLLKYVALLELLGSSPSLLLLVAPVMGRSAAVLLMLTTSYVRQQGLASDMVAHLPGNLAWLLLSLVAGLLLIWLGWLAVGLLLSALILFAIYRRALLERLQGFTGDAAGALIEIIELLVLLMLALPVSQL